MGSGKYYRSFNWLIYTTSKDQYGQQQATFPVSSTILWGYIEDLSALKILKYGVYQSEAEVRIHVQNWPSIQFQDRLSDRDTNETYIIDGISRSVKVGQELLIDCHRAKATR